MVVGVHRPAQALGRQVGDHLVGVHVRRRARAGLEDVDREVVVPLGRRPRRPRRRRWRRRSRPSTTPRRALTTAAAPLIAARAAMRRGSMRTPEMGKFSVARWVWAAHLAQAGHLDLAHGVVLGPARCVAVSSPCDRTRPRSLRLWTSPSRVRRTEKPPGDNVRPMTPRHRRLGVLVGIALLFPVMTAPALFADPLADKRAEAARIQEQLERAGGEGQRPGRAVEPGPAQGGRRSRGRWPSPQADLARSDERLQAVRARLATAAVLAYVHGGNNALIGKLARGGQDDMIVRTQYLRVTAADQRRVIGEVRTAKQDFELQKSRLETSRRPPPRPPPWPRRPARPRPEARERPAGGPGPGDRRAGRAGGGRAGPPGGRGGPEPAGAGGR